MEEKEAVETVNLENVFEYIKEREEILAEATEKLRTYVERIANFFGDEDRCQVCGRYKTETHKDHEFIPKVYVSIQVSDDEAFYESEKDQGDTYVLAVNREGMCAEIYCEDEYCGIIDIADLPRKAVKELVRSGRIPKFLAKVSQNLEKVGKEYEEVAQVAERLAAALSLTTSATIS